MNNTCDDCGGDVGGLRKGGETQSAVRVSACVVDVRKRVRIRACVSSTLTSMSGTSLLIIRSSISTSVRIDRVTAL